MLLRGLMQCARNLSFRFLPVFPQVQFALPAIERSPLAIMKPNEESKKMDLVEWLQESFLQFATPKKRVCSPHLFLM